jgi:PAS domain S-box-containing protein
MRKEGFNKKREGILLGILWGTIAAAMVAATGLGSIWYLRGTAEEMLEQATKERVRSIAGALAAQIRLGDHERVILEADPRGEIYTQVIRPLVLAHQALPEIKYLYTLKSDGSQMWIVMDTATQKELRRGDLTPSGVMEPYETKNKEETKAMAEAIQEGRDHVPKEGITDAFGVFWTALSSIGNQSAVGVDISVEEHLARMAGLKQALEQAKWALLAIATLTGLGTGLLRWRLEKDRQEIGTINRALLSGGTALVKTDAEGKILWADETFRRMTGFQEPDYLGKSPGRLMKGENKRKPEIRLEIRHAMRDRRKWKGNLLNTKKSGDLYWVELEILPTEDGGWIGIQRDISEEVARYEGLLEDKERAERGMQAKNEFLASMGHELRTPLNGVIGYCSLMENIEHSKEQEEYILGIKQCGENLLALINDILDFARLEQKGDETEAFDPREMIESTAGALRSLAEKKGLKLVISGPNIGWVRGNKTALRKILNNLIGNAIKFTDKGEVKVTWEWSNGLLRVTVTDTGIGIKAGTEEKIFEPFSQVDGSNTRRHEGAGLGLAISKKAAEAAGGSLSLIRMEGSKGSKFQAELPAEKAVPVRLETSPEKGRKGKTILLAEDNDINQKVGILMLKRLGHETEIAVDGHEAVKKACQKKYDLILMDIHMPGMDGIAATAILRAGGYKGRIVAMTADNREELKDACLRSGMDAFMPKPMTLKALMAEVGDSQ